MTFEPHELLSMMGKFGAVESILRRLPMKNVSAFEASCLRDEMERVTDAVRHCDYGSTSMEEHIYCY